MNLNLEHLKFHDSLIADQELIFLYGLVKSINPKTIVEVGGGGIGYSSMIFLDAMKSRKGYTLYSIDTCDMIKRIGNHKLLKKSCDEVTPEDLDSSHIDIIFFDAHVLGPQIDFFNKMVESKLVTDKTILILHDTNCFHEPFLKRFLSMYPNFPGIKTENGFVHQPVERSLVNFFKLKGYDVFSLNTEPESHDKNYEYLFGLTICQKFKPFEPIFLNY